MYYWMAAFQALIILAEIKSGDSVLIHAGASGVGIAAIQLARLYGASVLSFPQLNVFLYRQQQGCFCHCWHQRQDRIPDFYAKRRDCRNQLQGAGLLC
jgi:hypothetical protein